MPRLEELVKQIDELDPVEREELALALLPYPFKRIRLSSPLESPSIVSTPGVCGGVPRFIRTRIPVWTVERMRQLGASDLDILRSFPTLRAEDLVEARTYAVRHREEIEQSIRENESDEDVATIRSQTRGLRRVEIDKQEVSEDQANSEDRE